MRRVRHSGGPALVSLSSRIPTTAPTRSSSFRFSPEQSSLAGLQAGHYISQRQAPEVRGAGPSVLDAAPLLSPKPEFCSADTFRVRFSKCKVDVCPEIQHFGSQCDAGSRKVNARFTARPPGAASGLAFEHDFSVVTCSILIYGTARWPGLDQFAVLGRGTFEPLLEFNVSAPFREENWWSF